MENFTAKLIIEFWFPFIMISLEALITPITTLLSDKELASMLAVLSAIATILAFMATFFGRIFSRGENKNSNIFLALAVISGIIIAFSSFIIVHGDMSGGYIKLYSIVSILIFFPLAIYKIYTTTAPHMKALETIAKISFVVIIIYSVIVLYHLKPIIP